VEKHWAMGSVTGVAVDAQDHIWVSNRGVDSLQNNEKGRRLTPWASEGVRGAPQILEFDAAGTLLNSWGGPGQGYQWPQNPSGIAVDSKGNVWIAAAGAPVAAGARGAAAARGAVGIDTAPRCRSASCRSTRCSWCCSRRRSCSGCGRWYCCNCGGTCGAWR